MRTACLATATLSLFAAGAGASSLYGISLDGDLYRLGTDGSYEMIGSTGLTGVGGLDWVNGALYAHTGTGGAAGALYSINPATAQAALIGDLGVSFQYEGAIAYRGDGFAYAIGGRDDGAGLFDVNLATGAATELGTLSLHDINGLAMRSDGALVGFSQLANGLFTIDPSTMQTELLLNVGQVFGQTAIGGMATSDGARAYVVTDTVTISGTPRGAWLYEVDLYSGEVSFLVDYGAELGITGIAVPAPGAAGVLLAALPLAARRRRRS